MYSILTEFRQLPGRFEQWKGRFYGRFRDVWSSARETRAAPPSVAARPRPSPRRRPAAREDHVHREEVLRRAGRGADHPHVRGWLCQVRSEKRQG